MPPPHGTVPQCYKVISKCVFTCQKCPFSTTKLYHLNEHVKSEHLQLDDSAHVCTFCSYITDKKTNLKVINMINSREFLFNKFIYLSFSVIYIIIMLVNRIHRYFYRMTHFYQIQIQSKRKQGFLLNFFFSLLIRFQCGLCRRYQTNVDEFIKHITEKHRMDVNIPGYIKKTIFEYLFFIGCYLGLS
jgi:hypothetical protein